MPSLSQTACETCTAGGKPLAETECTPLLQQIPGWQIDIEAGVAQLRKTYRFANFSQALGFTNQIGRIAEEQDHHPALLTEWGKVTVRWWSHSVAGLQRNDFIMAARTDEVASQAEGLRTT